MEDESGSKWAMHSLMLIMVLYFVGHVLLFFCSA